jgi:hypothetical protein
MLHPSGDGRVQITLATPYVRIWRAGQGWWVWQRTGASKGGATFTRRVGGCAAAQLWTPPRSVIHLIVRSNRLPAGIRTRIK